MKNDDQDVYGLKCFLLMFLAFNLSSAFTFQCPSPYQWDLRAESHCITTDGYICLFDENKNIYKEICRSKTYFDPAGYKLVIAGNLDRRKCESAKYQPFKFFTNGSSVCIFEKSYCSDEGQIIFNNGSTESDRQCRCDYTRGYDFITKPKHGCYCVPSIEDCSCYQKPCPPGSIVSPDYQCINLTSWNSQFTCELILPFMPKDTTTFPSNDNTLDDNKAAPKRNVRYILSIMIGVTIIFTLIIAEKNVLTENVGLRYILAGQVIPKNIRDLQQHIKTQWKERFSNFVETRAYKAIIETMKEEQCFIISGPFGCGKSSLAFHIALELEKTLEYDFMIISNPDDLLRYASKDKKQIFLIDDVFGKYSISEYDTMWWNRQGESLQHLLTRNANLILLLTCRLHIYKYFSVNVIPLKVKVCHINLISEDLVLTYEDRQAIGGCYIYDDVINNLGEKVVLRYSFFPALCANFYDYKTENDIQYFTLPLECVKTEIDNIRKSEDLFYLALSVLVVCDNSVQKDVFTQNNQKYDAMLKFVSKELGYGKKTPKELLLLHLIALTGSYVSEKDSSFECINVDLFHVLAFCIGPSIMNSILRYGTMSFIIERMQPETASGHYPNLTIIISKSLLEIYFERVLVEMKTGSYDMFIRNQHVLAEYSESFITYMKKNLKKDVLKKSIESNTTVLHVVSAEGYEEYVDFFLGLDKNMVNQQDNYGQTALHKACMKGHINISKLLLDHGASIDIYDNDNKTALDFACDSGRSDMVEFLLSRKAKIRQKTTDFRTALHVACENDKFKIAELLLKHKANVNTQDYHGYTPLHLACKNGHVDIIELLLKHKPKVDLCDNKRRTALFFAAYRNEITTVKFLLHLGANPNISTHQSRVPLHCACERGSVEVTKLLITHQAVVDFDDEQNMTPLCFACKNGHLSVAELLLLNKANVNKRNEFRNTPLLIACKTNHIEVVKLLLNNNADVDCKNKAQLTPLLEACENNNKDIVSLLIKHEALINESDIKLQTPLFLTCLKGYQSVMAELLRHGACVTKANQNGQTPLHITCREGHEESVTMLLNAGANVNADDNDGMTPLHMACEGEKEQIVKLLLNAGVDLNMRYRDGSKPLDIARQCGIKEIVALLKANVGVNSSDKDGMPSLHMACKEGNKAEVNVLLNAGAYVNEMDKDGMTPLHVACKAASEQIVNLLINACVNVNEVDKDGMTPLHVACKGGSEQIVTLLINAGVNVNKGDKNGITPLHMACKEGNEAIVKVLLHTVVNVNESDIDGTTPLHMACKSGDKKIVTLLLNADANVNKSDKNGDKPLHMAKFGSKETLNALSDSRAKGDANEFVIVDSTCKSEREEIVRLLLDAGANVNQKTQKKKSRF